MADVGKVYLVGAGPGDPGLLTLKGRACLAEADLVLYDGLVNPLLLRHSCAVAERTSRTCGPDGKRLDQEEINQQLVEAARSGRTVVRLKGGDPFVFGRGTEEAAALRAAGIPFEVVPGITAATAAGVYAGISVTHRKLASAVAFVTGHEDPTKTDTLDYAALAKFPGTLVFYMGLARLPAITQSLIQHGLSADTPACVVSRASTPHQRTVSGQLGEVAESVARAELPAPSLIVVGPCARQHESLRWFEDLPLFGKRIGVTRSSGQADDIVELITQLGGQALTMPLLDIEPPEDFDSVDAAIDRLAEFNWLVVTSANGVRFFLNRIHSRSLDARCLGGVQIAAVGTSTAEALSAYGLKADFVSTRQNAHALAESLEGSLSGARVLWVRGNRGRNTLQTGLEARGAVVESVTVYHSSDRSLEPAVREAMASGGVDWVGLSSPSIARGLAAGLESLPGTVRLAAISPDTARVAEDAGLPVAAVAATASWSGILQAIVNHEVSDHA